MNVSDSPGAANQFTASRLRRRVVNGLSGIPDHHGKSILHTHYKTPLIAKMVLDFSPTGLRSSRRPISVRNAGFPAPEDQRRSRIL